MRRTSIITIVLLVVVIIGLTGALVYTNLPDAEETQSETAQNSQSQSDTSSDTTVTETPTEVSLDSDIVADMYDMIDGKTVYQSRNILHYTNKGVLTADDLTDEDIQTIAFFYEAYDYIEDYSLTSTAERTITAEEMDSAVKHVFGDIEYNHTYVYVYDTDTKVLEYDQDRNLYVYTGGLGGGDGVNTALTGISKVEEYSDRYEVTEKLLYWECEVNQSANTAYFNIYSYYYTDTNFTGVKLLDKLYSGSTLTFENISADEVNLKDLYVGGDVSDTRKVLLSAYYDEATEYKHTFMKNEDGTYYWVKTEIVK